MSRSLVELHVVCRGSLHVREEEGCFATGFWNVGDESARTLRFIALHESMDDKSYRQGEVIRYWRELHNGKSKAVFLVRPVPNQVEWAGARSQNYGRVYD